MKLEIVKLKNNLTGDISYALKKDNRTVGIYDNVKDAFASYKKLEDGKEHITETVMIYCEI